MTYVLLLFLVFFAYLLWEYIIHSKNVNAIGIRILVNGSRGKSSVTRLIAAGLRAGGVRTFAKTTGTTPRIIHSDGSEDYVNRRGSANIIEQKRILRKAVGENADVVVFECMSLRPELQWIEANRLLKPNIYVITNVRSDHLDIMGPTVKDSARYMMASVPGHSMLFTAEDQIYPLLDREAKNKGLKIVGMDKNRVSNDELSRFGYLEHQDNVALALSVLKSLGIDRNKALQGMYEMNPEPGALRKYVIHDYGKVIHFINAMAANDPDSTKLIWDRFTQDFSNKVVLVNCRADRIDRSKQLADLCAKDIPAEFYFVTGSLTKVYIKRALSLGISPDKISDLGAMGAKDIYNKVLSASKNGTLVFAIGNIVIFGHKIVNLFASKATYDS